MDFKPTNDNMASRVTSFLKDLMRTSAPKSEEMDNSDDEHKPVLGKAAEDPVNSTTQNNIISHGNQTQNIIGDNNHITLHHSAEVIYKTVVKTGCGVLNAQQKSSLQQLVSRIVKAEKYISGRDLSYLSVWKSLNRHMSTNSYHEIESEKFEKAHDFLKEWERRLDRIGVIPKHSSEMIDKIHELCNNNPKFKSMRFDYMKHYCDGEVSMLALSYIQIVKMYRYLFGQPDV